MVGETMTPHDPLLIRLSEVGSTNTYLKQLVAAAGPEVRQGLTVSAVAQTAGRGQRGNSWEADPGANVTVSVLLAPEGVPAVRQFVISQLVALATAMTADHWLPDGMTAQVKWPNDIYVGDRKLAGILIENSLAGMNVRWSVCGIGLNVNQPQWRSDAPNPVSLRELRGGEPCDRDAVEAMLRLMLTGMAESLYGDDATLSCDDLHDLYMSRLWRGKGVYGWTDTASGEVFEASVGEVAPTGHLTLVTSGGAERVYAFKEVAACL